jgi:hypothetical protein
MPDLCSVGRNCGPRASVFKRRGRHHPGSSRIAAFVGGGCPAPPTRMPPPPPSDREYRQGWRLVLPLGARPHAVNTCALQSIRGGLPASCFTMFSARKLLRLSGQRSGT